MKPVRLQLSRHKGFNLQALSMQTNGLAAVPVARPSMWGNPFTIAVAVDYHAGGLAGSDSTETPRQTAIRWFREWLSGHWSIEHGSPPSHADIVRALRGKNLACWCRLDQPCHANVLLELANQ